MIKWIRLLRFIKKHRKNGCASFGLITTGTEVVVFTRPPNLKDYPKEQIRFNY